MLKITLEVERRPARPLARRVECPECGAEPGEHCRLWRPKRNGEVHRASVHEARYRLYEDKR